jgi:hypothetical protein
MSDLGRKIMGALPPMHELARQVGLDLPDFLGKVAGGRGGPPAVAAHEAPAKGDAGSVTATKGDAAKPKT